MRKIGLWILCAGFLLALLSSNAGRNAPWNPVEGLIVELTAPFQKLITETSRRIESVWMDYFYLVNLRQQNQSLVREVERLRMENSRYREQLAEYPRLQALLGFKQRLKRPAVAARVIGMDPSGWFKSVIIDKGRRDGLKLHMPVVHAAGVVGKIVSVAEDYAKVLLLIDQNSAVDCLVQRSRDRGMVRGMSRLTCKLDYVLKSSQVRVGDLVVTSGLGGIFPKGLTVGRVTEIRDVPGALFKEIEIRPAVDFSKLEEVLVVLKERGKSAELPKTP